MSRILLIPLAALVLATACSDGDKAPDGDRTRVPAATERAGAGGDLPSREEDLRRTVAAAFDAFAGGEIDAFYGHFSEGFQERCPKDDFRKIMALAVAFMGDALDEASIEVTDVRYEGERAFVEATVEAPGLEEGLLEGEGEDEFLDFWVLEDGEWKSDTDDEKPCGLDTALGGGDEDRTPVTGPGSSRSQPLPKGDEGRIGDLAARVVSVDLDATEAVVSRSDFADPPRAGYRFVLVRVAARHAGSGEETIDVGTSNFKITGSRNVLYDTFDNDSSCGFVEGEISGELFAGGVAEGDVCFQVREDETDLLLVIEPFFSFDEERLFLALE
jgi:hypothetical protein